MKNGVPVRLAVLVVSERVDVGSGVLGRYAQREPTADVAPGAADPLPNLPYGWFMTSLRAGRVQGLVAVVTGAARGQGRAHAVRLAEEGADLVLLDACAAVTDLGYPPATDGDLDETVALAEKAGARTVAGRADVRVLDEIRSVVADGVREFGRIDIVVANAGISAWGRLWEIAAE
ncbi:MAG: hypothetical protein QOI10_3873, partial [Solirubrobacterales bacterium]|nr:hypothetical protein [Solirubrobacterales bacterium]